MCKGKHVQKETPGSRPIHGQRSMDLQCTSIRLKRFAILSLMVNLCNWKPSRLLPNSVSMSTPIWFIYLNICANCITFTSETLKFKHFNSVYYKIHEVLAKKSHQITLGICIQNVHRWLTHTPAVACGSLSQRCQWVFRLGRTNQMKCIFNLGNWFWLLLQLSLSLQHFP